MEQTLEHDRKRKSNNAKYETSKITLKLLVTDFFVVVASAAATVVGVFSVTAFFAAFAAAACNGDILTTTSFAAANFTCLLANADAVADTEKLQQKILNYRIAEYT